MPILLFGSSGVEKKSFGRVHLPICKIHWNNSRGCPFVVLNCADYANNKELLSSVLFGYKKERLQGPIKKDTKGLIEEADKGVSVLDEVHRLSPEGQEKLFRYMDKGIISRMGDSGQNCELNVRLDLCNNRRQRNYAGYISKKNSSRCSAARFSGKNFGRSMN